MVAVQRFNQAKEQPIRTIYGCVTSGTQWRFLKLEEQILTIAFLRQVRYIFRAETITGQGFTVPHQSRKRYIAFAHW